MLKHGIDIKQTSAAKLATALATETGVDQTIEGFGDFVSDTARGVEPGNVAASLLYHAFASPAVHRVPGNATPLGTLTEPITDFPTLEELDTLENYIFAVADLSLEDVKAAAATLLGISTSSVDLAVGVFALEYRPAPGTSHQRHADLALSRTGVSRVGTHAAVYDGKLRGYLPFNEGDTEHTIRALPCRYTTWIAARSKAKENRFGPARPEQRGNDQQYWVPVHKLFNGTECLDGSSLTVTLETVHQNRKVERVHRHMEEKGFPTGFTEQQREQAPFVKEHGLADWIETHSGGRLLGPLPQPMVERASFEQDHLGFPSPAMGGRFSDAFSPTLSLEVPGVPIRPFPEYAHIRFKVEDGNAIYFGQQEGTIAEATAGGFNALNLSDSTGDGWVKADVSGLDGIENVPAYSLLAAPDFFPGVDQREVFEWWERMKDPAVVATLPEWFQSIISEGFWDFWRAQPIPLSDTSFAPNLKLEGAGFDGGDNTVTAVVSPLQRIDLRGGKPDAVSSNRHAVLPDSAAGVFAPGWDVSADKINSNGANRPSNTHLSAYGLGSPFPEDAKLCAALSTFWPAAAPDTQRTYFKVNFASGTVCPLTDEENGAVAGTVSWDGLRGPHVLSEDGTGTRVRYPNYAQADYSFNALEGQFSIGQTAKIGFQEYVRRIVVTRRMYRVMSGIGNTDTLKILSFSKIQSDDPTLDLAQSESGRELAGPIYRFDVFAESDSTPVANSDPNIDDLEVGQLFSLLVGTSDFLLAMARIGDGSESRSTWQAFGA